jgi:hypothetical protein
MLRNTDVSYLNLRDDAKAVPYNYVEPLELHDQVLRCNPEAFECSTAGKQSTYLFSVLNNFESHSFVAAHWSIVV